MGKELKRLKRCFTSTDAEASDHKDKKSLQIAEIELQNPETDVKKRKKKSESKQIDKDDLESKKTCEIKELKKVRKSLIEAMKNLQEEEPPKKFECCFETKDADGYYFDYIFVRGFDTALHRDVIRAALWKRFESLGCEVLRVFVPIECETGVPLGFAFICVVEEQKALDLGGGYMGEHLLSVMKAEDQSESYNFPNFNGCDRCWIILRKRRHKRFIARRGK